ncbi:hypothetical protein O181_126169 [Austropuccinia psidii MF-1]|uniref:Uncharacterized protein n=1 Tax=Austropuccinia psidii MF-1 TaxID=1389203 RepID=A0A9Q3KSU1_9BASI|nr:hypothetical protein [Austropuccinia psidii MF-1]
MLLKEGKMVRYSNGGNPLSSKPQIKKTKEWHNKKREVSKEEAPVAFTSKPQAKKPPQEGKENKKKNWKKSYPPVTGYQESKKATMDNVFDMARDLL